MLNTLLGVLSLVMIGAGLCYFISTTGVGILEERRQRRSSAAPGGTVDTSRRPRAVYFLVPCLNEEGVIGSTLTRLLTNIEARVVVIDDASDDHTADVVRLVGGDRTLLISRRLPAARKGKGPALNAGLPVIIADSQARGLDPSQVLVCVMDADGCLSDGAVGHVLPLFDDPTVGGAQLAVRIRNRDVNLLTTMQDFEFWGLSATSQLGRVRLGTVSLGGNGQFTRLSAICELGDEPWSAALTEDLDLALRLMGNGWRLTTTPEASVDQQAIVTLRALVRQRTRWFQGHMACIRHLRSLWGNAKMANRALLEVTAYLLIPWVFVLPWSIVFHIGLVQMLSRVAHAPGGTLGTGGPVVRIITVVAWYLLGFGPTYFAGYLYYRQDHSVGKVKALLLAHVLILYNYVAFVSCWLAAIRSLRGFTGWEKTARPAEGGFDYLSLPATFVAAPGRVTGRLKTQPGPAPARVAYGLDAARDPAAKAPATVASPALVLRFGDRRTPAPAASHTSVTAGAIVSRRPIDGDCKLGTATTVRATVKRSASDERLSAPPLTGRLRVAPRPEGAGEQIVPLGTRFLIGSSLADILPALKEKSA